MTLSNTYTFLKQLTLPVLFGILIYWLICMIFLGGAYELAYLQSIGFTYAANRIAGSDLIYSGIRHSFPLVWALPIVTPFVMLKFRQKLYLYPLAIIISILLSHAIGYFHLSFGDFKSPKPSYITTIGQEKPREATVYRFYSGYLLVKDKGDTDWTLLFLSTVQTIKTSNDIPSVEDSGRKAH